MKPLLSLSILALVAALFAGCVDAELATTPADDRPAFVVDETLRIEAFDCHQAGGNSVYNMVEGQTKVGPFYARDQNPEVADPMIGGYFRPVEGPTNGIWHVVTLCETYTYMGETYSDFGMGWVAQLIMPPEGVDTGDEPRLDFYVADLSFYNTQFVDRTVEATNGANINPGIDYVINWIVPNTYLHVILEEAGHGTFDFTGELHKEFGPKEDEHIRFWQTTPGPHTLLHETGSTRGEEGQQYTPIYFDVWHTQRDGPTMKLAGDSIGTFTHLPDMHWGNPLVHYWHGFDMVVELGGVLDEPKYDTSWLH